MTTSEVKKLKELLTPVYEVLENGENTWSANKLKKALLILNR